VANVADFVFNQALGRTVELATRVNNNDPANSALIVVVINAGGVSDATLKDLDTLTAVLGTAADEVTNTNYARKTLADGSITVTVDDTNDRTDVDFADQTWTSVAAGTAWTDFLICYDSDTTAGTDANIVPLTQHDFAVTPDGSSITAVLNAAGFFRAS
jgi:hypothetical protein